MRISKACRECRIGKRRCIDNATGVEGPCVSCQDRRIRCSKSLKTRATQSALILPSINVVRCYDDHGSPTTIVVESVELYFRYIHDRPHSLFHQHFLWNEIHCGTVDDCLLAAICALGCRFMSRDDRNELAVAYKTRSRTAFGRHLEQISLPHIQAAILIANLCAAELDNDLEALYFGIAVRMAYVLGLHQKRDDDPPVQQETKRRVMWSLYMADKWCPSGLGLPRELAITRPQLDFPMEELQFQLMDTGSNADYPPVAHGLWREMILLAEMLGQIQDLNISLVQGQYDQKAIDGQVLRLAHQLQQWEKALPEELVMNENNLKRMRERKSGGTFFAVHLGYHHYSTLLYFQYLETSTDDRTGLFAERCRSHALAFSRLLRHARQCEDSHVVYLTVAYMTMVSSSVLLHTLLSGTDQAKTLVRTELVSNFEALLEMKIYWPRMDTIAQRLLTFQHACMKSSRVRTHKIDKWMIRFLLEYGLPLEAKDDFNSIDPFALEVLHESRVELESETTLGQAFAALCT